MIGMRSFTRAFTRVMAMPSSGYSPGPSPVELIINEGKTNEDNQGTFTRVIPRVIPRVITRVMTREHTPG